MYDFGFAEYAIIIAALLFCILLIFDIKRNFKNKTHDSVLLTKTWVGSSSLIIGILFVTESVISFSLVREDISKTIQLFKPLAHMLSRPLILLLSIAIILGLTLIYAGILILRNKQKP